VSNPTNPLPAILAELAACSAQGQTVSNSLDMPATRALLDDAAAALERSTPARFEHGGRTFFLRVSIGLARLEVFDSPATAEPFCTAMHGSQTAHGHTPGH
jgi:hypothetical protein